MTKQKSTKRALLLSALSLLMCVSMLIGSTFAWFTDSVTSAGNKIQAGNLDVDLYLWTAAGKSEITNESAPIFGAGSLAQNVNTETLWEPGKTQVAYLSIKNNGSLDLKYKVAVDVEDADAEQNLYEVMKYAIVNDATYDTVNAWDAAKGVSVVPGVNATQANDVALKAGEEHFFALSIHMDESAGNQYMNGQVDFDVRVLATQLASESDSFDNQYDKDAEYPTSTDEWDGVADTSWYDPENPQTAYTFTTAEQLAGLSDLVSGDTTFAGVTFTLANDLDLYCEDTSENADGDPVTFRPIGDHSKNGTFEGTFDGNGKTVSNLYQNGWDLGYEWGVYGSYGLFGNVNDATIKNLTLSGGESYIEGGDTSFVAGSATGTCVFENITIEDSISATYNNGNGGIIGWSGEGNYTFKNISIAQDCVLAGLWGSFDSSIGGIVGQGEPGATYNFENVDIACRLDVYNDCTASYDYYNYRMCGMIIGRLQETTTIDGTNYPDTSKYNITCKDVTVTYGDWANYHYCEPTPGLNNGRGMRVEAGYSYDGLPADYDHSQCVDSCKNLLAFDQIFGGDQYGVKGLKSYDGVNVIYNNK